VVTLKEHVAHALELFRERRRTLRSRCFFLAKTHPHIDLVLTEIERGDMAGLANLENQPIRDAAIEG
jgi:hypothetical protein